MNYKIHATIAITRRSLPMLPVLFYPPPQRDPSVQEDADHWSLNQSRTSRARILSLWRHRVRGEYCNRNKQGIRKLRKRTRRENDNSYMRAASNTASRVVSSESFSFSSSVLAS